MRCDRSPAAIFAARSAIAGPVGIGSYAPTLTYYLGGGGGTLTIGAGPALGTAGATVEMGTSGLLLPGRVAVESMP